MTPLSVILITYNEEKNLDRCLKSVISVTDEIVVIDSFSQDKTAEICRMYNVKFYQRKWEGYSAAKNFGNEIALHDYILSIDADEELSPELQLSIREVKDKGFSGAYKMNRLTNYCGNWIRHGGWYPDTKIRLWNKQEGRWEGEIHEIINFTKKVTVTHLKGDIFHYSFYSVKDHLQKAQKFTDIASRDLFNQGKKSPVIKILFSPVVKFLKDYLIRLGFLDGIPGFTISRISAYATYLKYSKLRKLELSAKTRNK
jgi:glycosyltransferase involved in cell wall biosynthesis